ncbi:hypothetical protein KMW28_15555 [Flammeovirga yaeyamensis]|uniref:Prealbumin-like fold domain-containing protein n=1 Tax=Flammeovirga yaeyamensis TaxID=367791 RepID=A0AAX1N5D0_9BACT|nr:hypothetical protein [Flammeovirga yaeyamensis]MBB3698571.1 hypothetical protein [Flammeovirga yaeyamensis]NMF34080.1 hypothetical protein [Flammeovirga yaeyamensis]QWG01068.1 hypothetical protein KMW28_15555 [Flammeovirga yaeyamensis]
MSKLIVLIFIGILASSFNLPSSSESTTYFINPVLQVTVMDTKGNVVEGATVIIYETEDDAWDEENGVEAKTKTNHNGRVKFTKGLKEKAYYVVAKKGKLVSEDGLKSTKLKKNKLNKINVIIGEEKGITIPKMN